MPHSVFGIAIVSIVFIIKIHNRLIQLNCRIKSAYTSSTPKGREIPSSTIEPSSSNSTEH